MNRNELEHFLAVVRGLEEPRITLTDAYQALLLIEATKESIARHQPVRLHDEKD